MIGVLIEAGAALLFMGAEYAYHRWFEDKPVEKIKPQEVSIPRVDEGAPIPLFFGRCLVRGAVLVWTGTPDRQTSGGVSYYRMNMIFVVGIPMGDGEGTNKLYSMWAGDRQFGGATESATKETELTFEISSVTGVDDSVVIGSNVQFYDGNPAQDPGAGKLGALQIAEGVDVFQIPAYFGYFTVCLYTSSQKWVIGTSPNVATYSFEVSSYCSKSSYPGPGTLSQVGVDSNPANVLWSVLVDKLGKLGIPTSYLDKGSFTAAAGVLQSESHGYSRSFESSQTADEIIQDVLRQIDGAIDEDPSIGKLVLTLVRPIDPATIPHITRDNCDKLTGFVMSGWTGLPSSLRFIYENRNKDYNDDTIVMHNQGNAKQQGETEEFAVEMRGCKEPALALKLADREAQAHFRPIIKCSVHVGREFLRLVRGNAVKLTWKNPDISGLVFRIANVDRGTIDDGKIRLDLISDFYYSLRGQAQVPLIDRLDDYKDAITEIVTLG